MSLLERTLREINAIQREREAAILAMYERKGIRRAAVAVSREEVQEGLALLDAQDLQALVELKQRCQRIASVEKEAIRPEILLDENDTFHSVIRTEPLEAIGIYIPERMPSSLILYCCLAAAAGVRHIALALPPRQDGTISPMLLAAAGLFGDEVASILAVGGRSAFPALAFGLGGPRPSKLFGPCSYYVDVTKQLLATFYKVPVDLPAGPSELALFVDDERDVQQIVLDIRAQMEHGEDSVCFVLSTESGLLTTLRHALQDVASQLEYVLVESYSEAAEAINLIAPEILEVFSARADEIMSRVKNVGNAYLNVCSPLGDYCLFGKGCADATFGMAAGLSGVTIASFYRQYAVSSALKRPASPEPWLARLPVLEQFPSHSRAIQAFVSPPGE